MHVIQISKLRHATFQTRRHLAQFNPRHQSFIFDDMKSVHWSFTFWSIFAEISKYNKFQVNSLVAETVSYRPFVQTPVVMKL